MSYNGSIDGREKEDKNHSKDSQDLGKSTLHGSNKHILDGLYSSDSRKYFSRDTGGIQGNVLNIPDAPYLSESKLAASKPPKTRPSEEEGPKLPLPQPLGPYGPPIWRWGLYDRKGG